MVVALGPTGVLVAERVPGVVAGGAGVTEMIGTVWVPEESE